MLHSTGKCTSFLIGNFNPWQTAFILHQSIHEKWQLSLWIFFEIAVPKDRAPHSSNRLISLLSDGWCCNLSISNYMWWMWPLYHLIFIIGVHPSLFTTPQSSAAKYFFLRWLIGAFPSLESRVEIPGNYICSDVRRYLKLQLGSYHFFSP